MERSRLEITVSRAENNITLTEIVGPSRQILLDVRVVSGCEGTGTPAGLYHVGRWMKDKTNPAFGPIPWSKDPWGNPYGPFFLPLNSSDTGAYTTYGIHGTRGPLLGNFEKPPVPEALLALIVGGDNAKYLYCSHGCIRLSNQNVAKLFKLTTQPQFVGTDIVVEIK